MSADAHGGAGADALLARTLVHLRALVGFDTRNPPRTIGTGGIFDYLRAFLPDFAIRITDHGAGAVSLLAERGSPSLLFNVHLDTVPASPGWSADPLVLRMEGDRAIGLGACDIKGAAAALLSVAEATRGDMALLFSTDEEGSDPRCIAAFLAEGRRHPQVIVAEPTCCKAVLAHRGIQSMRICFSGRAGHASAAQAPADSALHQAVRWAAAALDYAQAHSGTGLGGLQGMRFNLGRIEGGIKSNVIAPHAEVRFGVRPAPGTDMDALLLELRGLADPAPSAFEATFRGAALPAANGEAPAQLARARALASQLGVPVGPAVDFWTEAALFSQAGCTTFVHGPGDIAQAHAADEWVELEQLRRYAEATWRIVEGRP